jgi:hypothetical protein
MIIWLSAFSTENGNRLVIGCEDKFDGAVPVFPDAKPQRRPRQHGGRQENHHHKDGHGSSQEAHLASKTLNLQGKPRRVTKIVQLQ